MRVIYIAGPFRAPNAWGIEQNVRRAEEHAVRLVEAFGVMPMIPHANTRYFHGLKTDKFWIEGTLELLRRCDALYLCPGWRDSQGSLGELDEAKKMGIPIFTEDNMNELREWAESPWGKRKQL
jgi:hypothetical protein